VERAAFEDEFGGRYLLLGTFFLRAGLTDLACPLVPDLFKIFPELRGGDGIGQLNFPTRRTMHDLLHVGSGEVTPPRRRSWRCGADQFATHVIGAFHLAFIFGSSLPVIAGSAA